MAFMVYCGSMDARRAALGLHFYVHCPNCLAGLASVLLYDSSAFFSSFALRDTRRIAVKVGVPTSSLCLSASQHVNSRRDLWLKTRAKSHSSSAELIASSGVPMEAATSETGGST